MHFIERIGYRNLAIGLGILVIIAIVAIPLTGYMKKKSKRAELPLLVESIRAAQLKNSSQFSNEDFISAEWAPRKPTALDGNPVEWPELGPNHGFTKLGWTPSTEGYEWVVGTYRIAADRNSFKVTGKCDIDGDGVPAVFEADQDNPVKQISAANIY